jgi:Xaa-Pro aminopeptidase
MFYRDDMKAIADKARAKVFQLCRDDADAIISTDTSHAGYLSGYRSVLLDADRNFHCAVILTRSRTMLVTGASDAAPALEVLRDPAVIYRYGVFYVSSRAGGIDWSAMPKTESTFNDALEKAIQGHVKPSHVVGLDAATPTDMQQLEDMVGDNTFDARPAIIKARSVKVPEEIEKMRQAAAITEAGMEKAFARAKAGVTELELSTIISSAMIAGGGIPRFVVVTSGERAALADAYASNKKLAKGDLVRVDLGCTVDGYWADMARTAVVGEPDREQQSRYDALLTGELAQLELARAGVTAGELFDIAVKGVRQGALPNYQRSHCGHGLGIGAHEFPTLNPANRDVPIEENMVLCVETPYYELGWGGMMVEDIIVIRNDGNESLTKLPRELWRVGGESAVR